MKSYGSRFLPWILILGLIRVRVVNSDAVGLVLITPYGERIHSTGSECGSGVYFERPLQFSCACVTGLWAFYESWCTIPLAIVAGSNICMPLNSKLNQASLLSSPESLYFPSLTRLTSNAEQLKEVIFKDSPVNWNSHDSLFISVGGPEWELRTRTGETYCLKPTANTTSFCLFSDIGDFKIEYAQIGCSMDENIILSDTCSPFITGDRKDEKHCQDKLSNSNYGDQFVESMEDIQENRRRNIVKRAASPYDDFTQDHPPGQLSEDDEMQQGGIAEGTEGLEGRAGLSDAEGDEDFLDPAQALVKNNPLIMEQLSTHVQAEVSEILGNSGPRNPSRRYPVLQILEASLEVMKKTCDVVSSVYFDLAMDTFINIQLDSLHIKEPYIAYPSFLRIQKALSACIVAAGPHVFQQGENNTNMNTTVCDGDKKKQYASETLLKDGKAITLQMPDDRKGAGYEPIIETVWKILVNAHSYCYEYFSDYYNDHHSYTVSLMPLFTNEIQYLWMPEAKNGKYVEPNAELYGGVIGDHVPLLKNIDFCVSASRVDSAYPWFMNRPPKDSANKWRRRRKRSVRLSGQHCLNSPQDVNKLKLLECNK